MTATISSRSASPCHEQATAATRAHREVRIGLQEFALLALLGFGVGIYGTLVGAGGGFLVGPLLLLIYKLPPPVAAATSLCVVFLNAASGSISYFRGGRVDVRSAWPLALATLPGALLIGPWIATHLPDRAFKIIFALFLIAMSIFLLLKPERKEGTRRTRAEGRWWVVRSFTDREGHNFEYAYSMPVALAIAFFIGILSSMLGIGGGIVHVPVMIHVMSFPVHIATATSHFVLAFSALAGVINYAIRGNVNWPIALSIGGGVVIGAQVGAKLSRRMGGRWIVRLLTIAVVALAARLIMSAMKG